jgi:hypothetical protein
MLSTALIELHLFHFPDAVLMLTLMTIIYSGLSAYLFVIKIIKIIEVIDFTCS